MHEQQEANSKEQRKIEELKIQILDTYRLLGK